MAVAIRRSPASPLDLTRFAQVEAASSPVLRHIPKRIPHPFGWCFFLERATGKAAQRRLRRMQQAAFKAVPRLADTNVAAGRLAQRGHSRGAREKNHHPIGW